MRLASVRDLSFHSSSDCSVDFVNNEQTSLFADHTTSASPAGFRHNVKKINDINVSDNRENDITQSKHTVHDNYVNRNIKEEKTNNSNIKNVEQEQEEELFTSNAQHTSLISHGNELNESPKRNTVKSSMHTITPESSFVSAFSTENNREQNGKVGNASTLTTSFALNATPHSTEQQVLRANMPREKNLQNGNITQPQTRIVKSNNNRFVPANINIESIDHNDE